MTTHFPHAALTAVALALAELGLGATAFAQSTDAASSKLDTVELIVTGTRQSGLKAADSPAPVQVLDANSLKRTGQPDLVQALSQNLPSFTAQSFGGDASNLTLSARLRGLSPNQTLVLINGKRRHTTANLSVGSSAFQGGAATDLNFIPVAAIDHVEVLQDGAAAQYGTDAIAGVINIILKNNDQGGSISGSGGAYFDGGGETGSVSGNLGIKPVEDAYLNLSAETKYHGHSDRGDPDPRTGTNVNHIFGDAKYRLLLLSGNAGYDFGGGTELYSFATLGHKSANSFENYRLPNRLPTIYPQGFSPQMTLDEDDYAVTVGVKGRVGDWYWDFSSSYGADEAKIGVIDSGNTSLFADTGSTPTNFSAGRFNASQWTNNLDLNREVNVGWSTPLNLAFGLEQRSDRYEITAGDAASRYKTGSQSYPGFSLTDAGGHLRNDVAGYLDFAGSPVDKLKLDAAARIERYNDFGIARVAKLTGRYDFTPAFAVRGTASTGFRAPTLAEQYYSATNVSPTSAFVQLPPNSAGARLVGVDGLKPEKSRNVSLGLVVHPSSQLSATLDVYQIDIRDRIVGGGQLFGSGGAVNSPSVVAAILANGNVLDPTVTFTGINIFTNAADTRNRGAELVLTYSDSYGDLGRVDWSAAANYNQVKVRRINQAPSQLAPQVLLNKVAISNLEDSSPTFRVNLGALWRLGAWTVNLRESIYGPSSGYATINGSTFYESKIDTKFITDLDVTNQITKAFSVTLGANNLFNTYPNKINSDLAAAYKASGSTGAVLVYPTFSSIGINGGFYYAKATYKF